MARSPRIVWLVCLLGASLLMSACVAPSRAPTSPTQLLGTSFLDKRDGTMPVSGDDGVPFVENRSPGAEAPVVEQGALVGRLPDGRSASYIQQVTRGKIVRLGAEFAFAGGAAADGGNGALCLAAWREPMPSPIVRVPDAPFHLVTNRTSIGLTSWSGDRQSGSLLNYHYARPLPLDTRLRVEIMIEGDRATVDLPDGSIRTATNLDLATIPGAVANWEYFKYGPGDADVKIYRMWATSR